VGDEEHLGKPVGSDLRQGTITLPVICLREILTPEEFRAAFDSDDVSGVIELVRSGEAVERARAEAEGLLDEAREALMALPPCDARDALEALTQYVVERHV
jgi:geranylgeranyl pyrophosphate synthase